MLLYTSTMFRMSFSEGEAWIDEFVKRAARMYESCQRNEVSLQGKGSRMHLHRYPCQRLPLDEEPLHGPCITNLGIALHELDPN